jgi:hypothetical protein
MIEQGTDGVKSVPDSLHGQPAIDAASAASARSRLAKVAGFAGIIAVLSVCCGIIKYASLVYIDPLWLDPEWRRPVTNWLISTGNARFIGNWAVVYGRLPEWLMAVIIGFCIGGVFGRKWAIIAIPCAAALIGVFPLVLWLAGELDYLDQSLVLFFLWDIPAALLLCFSAFLASSRKTISD